MSSDQDRGFGMGRTFLAAVCLVLLAAAGGGGAGAAEPFDDEENCLMCHKYRKMGRVTEDGVLRSYTIVPEIFSRTVHRNVPCRDCHTEIKELPHKPVAKGVSCDTECHSIKNPATGRPFSHKTIVEVYRKSNHGREKNEEGPDRDKPYCIACHTNPLYNPAEEQPPARIVDRCVVCHEKRKFVNAWYNHTSRRIREVRRSSEEIVVLCSSCHGDKKLVDRRLKTAAEEGRPMGRKFPLAVESYDGSFHGKMTRYGFAKAANCLDCHADAGNYYLSVHEMRPSRDERSSVGRGNRIKTCQRCHPYADASFGAIDPHPTADRTDNPFRHYVEKGYGLAGYLVPTGMLALAMFETIGRRRDGISWMLRHGTSWRRRGRRGRDRHGD